MTPRTLAEQLIRKGYTAEEAVALLKRTFTRDAKGRFSGGAGGMGSFGRTSRTGGAPAGRATTSAAKASRLTGVMGGLKSRAELYTKLAGSARTENKQRAAAAHVLHLAGAYHSARQLRDHYAGKKRLRSYDVQDHREIMSTRMQDARRSLKMYRQDLSPPYKFDDRQILHTARETFND